MHPELRKLSHPLHLNFGLATVDSTDDVIVRKNTGKSQISASQFFGLKHFFESMLPKYKCMTQGRTQKLFEGGTQKCAEDTIILGVRMQLFGKIFQNYTQRYAILVLSETILG